MRRSQEAIENNRQDARARYWQKVAQGLCVQGGCWRRPAEGRKRCSQHLGRIRRAHGAAAARTEIDRLAEGFTAPAGMTRRCWVAADRKRCQNPEHDHAET